MMSLFGGLWSIATNVLQLYAVVCRLCAVGKIAYRCCYVSGLKNKKGEGKNVFKKFNLKML